MKSQLPLALFFTSLLGWISPALAAPDVSNLTASQRAETKLVDIDYDLASPFGSLAVSLEISSDGGATWTVPASSASGDVGASVAPGTGKAIVWDAGADWAGNYSEQMRFRVVADDGVTSVPDFAEIPGGSFTMGRTSGDSDSNAPPITVTVSAFYLSETQTTKALWDEVRMWGASNGYSDLRVGGGKAANHPVHTVSWFDMVKWCNARSEKDGLTPVYTVGGGTMRTGTTAPDVNWSANGYRLPTEAEWEKAARGGVEGKRFPWGGDEINHVHANYRSYSVVVYDTNNYSDFWTFHPDYDTGGEPYTSPVGSFAANAYGLYDMAGNVWDSCWDWSDFNYYTTSNGTTDPRGPASGSSRVVRGGSWYNYASHVRCSYRNDTSPSDASDTIGFRSARSSVP